MLYIDPSPPVSSAVLEEVKKKLEAQRARKGTKAPQTTPRTTPTHASSNEKLEFGPLALLAVERKKSDSGESKARSAAQPSSALALVQSSNVSGVAAAVSGSSSVKVNSTALALADDILARAAVAANGLEQTMSRREFDEGFRAQQRHAEEVLQRKKREKELQAEREQETAVGSKRPAGPDDDNDEDLKRSKRETKEEESKSSVPAFKPFANLETQRDHLGRGFTHQSHAQALQFAAERKKATSLPSKIAHCFKGHDGNPIQQLAWLPAASRHLLLASDMSGRTLLWDAFGDHRLVGTYVGHSESSGGCTIKSLAVIGSGERFSTAAADGWIREWDAETGQLVTSIRPSQIVPSKHVIPPCSSHAYHPTQELVMVAGVGRQLVMFDLRVPNQGTRVLRQYDGHMGNVMHLSFVQEGRQFVSTSEDKTVRIWDIGSSVSLQDYADPSMHALPHVVEHPTTGRLYGQSFDNRIYEWDNNAPKKRGPGSSADAAPIVKYKLMKEPAFEGHSTSGSNCQLAINRDGKYLSSGDVHGQLWIWDLEAKKKLRSFRAHSKPLVSHIWHPTLPSTVATSSWDGLVKIWQ